MYVASPRLLVYDKQFAHRFSTRKQAEAYIFCCDFKKQLLIAEEIDISVGTTE